MVKIAIIIGSVRPNRFGPKAATWLQKLASQTPDASFDIIDLQHIALPFLDEPQPPSQGNYQQAHTKRWSKQIDQYDGFVFVTPEYNHSYSPALKNAIDFLDKEWQNKSVAFVGYGSKAGGARAIEHLRGVIAWLNMFGLAEHVIIPNYWTQVNEQGEFQPTDRQTDIAKAMIDELAFWAEHFKKARQAKLVHKTKL